MCKTDDILVLQSEIIKKQEGDFSVDGNLQDQEHFWDTSTLQLVDISFSAKKLQHFNVTIMIS